VSMQGWLLAPSYATLTHAGHNMIDVLSGGSFSFTPLARTTPTTSRRSSTGRKCHSVFAGLR
jgi:hypothetical protein